jgi:hypothetical protein
MVDKEWTEEQYSRKDPWEYENDPADIERKEKIISSLKGRKFKRVLDIGGGEGWITKDLPGEELYNYEISDRACSRLPSNVKRETKPNGKYDLIICTGVMYDHYDVESFFKIIKEHSSGLVLLCNVKDWEVNLDSLGNPVFQEIFPYKKVHDILQYQDLRIYDKSST